MTRDTIRVHSDRDFNDADVYAALWAAAPFPRLPDDAPRETRKATIEIDDPRAVYTIHKASRKHHFNVLVDRYILQVRYGCTSTACNTPTCFSCRKRLANGAPIRRYNSSSARSLAIHLASQDNPEHGLCHNTPAARPVQEVNRPSKLQRPLVADTKTAAAGLESGDAGTTDGLKPKSISNSPTRKSSIDITLHRNPSLNLSIFEENANDNDHRSFVQNLVGTFAYKVIEWLVPRNFQELEEPRPEKKEEKSSQFQEHLSDSTAAEETQTQQKVVRESVEKAPAEDTQSTEVSKDELSHTELSNPHDALPARRNSISKHVLEADGKIPHVDDPKTTAHIMPKPKSTPRRRKPDVPETHGLKGILNKTPKVAEVGTEVNTPSNRSSAPVPRRKPSQALVTSPKPHTAELAPFFDEPFAISKPLEPCPKPVKEEESKDEPSVSKHPDSPKPITPVKMSPKMQPSTQTLLPQSLSVLSIEVIDLMCDILQEDNNSENHDLHPRSTSEILKRRRNNVAPLQRAGCHPSMETKRHWLAFIQQSLFHVLSRPESLIQSFSDEEKKLFDTQTIWYLMLRMTRVAPSLVFDSLWIAAGSLFRPPNGLEDTLGESEGSRKAISNHDAAQTINICLHALVAAAPLIFDARQLANMSRIRSYGLAMLGRESSSLEPVSLCLQYEDAFTNDLALRLARRLFAAIPTRRRFQELLDLQVDIRTNDKREPDVLDTVLDTLKFLDLGTPPVIYFPDDERDLHEKRVPTLLLDWARTVMLQDWKGTAVVSSDGPFGGALATIAAIYKKRKSLLLGDIHFRTEYFAERLDTVDMPLEWLNFVQNKKTVHLLDHPYLFNPSTLVTYFRAINYSRMNEAYETAKATSNLMYSAAEENRLMTDSSRRSKLYERLRTSTTRFMVLEIRRSHVLVDTFNSIWRREERELTRPLKIRLGEDGGEEGLDSGGVQQEFFRLAIAEALDPKYGAFTIDSRTKMTWFQPGSPEPLWKFELIGMIVSLAVYNGLTLPVTFPKALYRKLLDKEVTELHHIADGWPDLANGLTSLLEWDEKDGLVEDIFARTYEFSVEQFGQPISREMGVSGPSTWPQFSDMHTTSNPEDAPMVTNANRNAYVSDYIRFLTSVSIAPQYAAFKKGFFTCLSPRSITLFDPPTLQSLIEGVQDIDIMELRRSVRYIGWDASHRTIRDFWSIVKRYDLEMKKKLLEFVTASDRVPVGGMRNVMFTIQRNGVGDGHLPSSYTCYGILLLPEFSSKEVLRGKLEMALENSKGFGFA